MRDPAPALAAIPTPLDVYRDVVRGDWIDSNGHLNMGYYVVVFDFATDAWMGFAGLDRLHRRERHITTFCLETHVTYVREVRVGDPLRFTTRLLGFDARRLHYYHEMYHATEGYLAATNELMSLHVSQVTRRAAPMAHEILAFLARIREAHAVLPASPHVGRVMGLHARPTTREPDRPGAGESHPVFRPEPGDSPEMGDVVGDQGEPSREGVGCDERVERADRRAAPGE